MRSSGDQGIALLRDAGVVCDRGLQRRRAPQRRAPVRFIFAPDHAELLRLAVPVDGPPQPKGVITRPAHENWPDWRHGKTSTLADRLAWPTNGILFDVRENNFWPASWGARPQSTEAAQREARDHLLTWPKLVPIYGHRYLPAAPAPASSPVFSVYQADVIYYGANLVDYLNTEFRPAHMERPGPPVRHLFAPWSDLAMGADAGDL